MTRKNRLGGCIIGGAIGDAWGSAHENVSNKNDNSTFYLYSEKNLAKDWSFTDDTQLTLVTLEALLHNHKLTPEILAGIFAQSYKKRQINGIGASTLKALQELENGAHWSQVGRMGEFAAGNGAAMRIAPFSFWNEYTRDDIRNFCRITHRNEDAYTGALAVVISIQQILENNWNGDNNLIELICPHLPDTNVRDRLIELNEIKGENAIAKAAKRGTNGYVVNSVPFAIFCASQVKQTGIENMYEQIINSCGDTDTNASIAGQIAGTLIGENDLPTILKQKLKIVRGYDWMEGVLHKAKEKFI